MDNGNYRIISGEAGLYVLSPTPLCPDSSVYLSVFAESEEQQQHPNISTITNNNKEQSIDFIYVVKSEPITLR